MKEWPLYVYLYIYIYMSTQIFICCGKVSFKNMKHYSFKSIGRAKSSVSQIDLSLKSFI